MKVYHQVKYCVCVKTDNPNTSSRFVSWMMDEHMSDLLKIPGCEESKLWKLSELLFHCEYFFTSQKHLDDYLQEHAAEMRQRCQKSFSPGELSFERNEQTLISHKVE